MNKRVEKASSEPLDRRQAMKLLGMGACIGIPPLLLAYRHEALDLLTDQTDAEKAFLSFPEEMDGARSVEKTRWRGAKHCLVHVLQFHPKLTLSDRAFEGVILSQRDIRKVLYDLMQNPEVRLKEIYNEGDAGPHTLNETRVLQILYKDIRKHGEIREQTLRALLADMPEDFMMDLRLHVQDMEVVRHRAHLVDDLSAAYALERDNGLRILPAESLKEFDDPLEPRNQQLLRIVSDNRETLAVTVFGAAHDFKMSIERWNDEHPQQKFCHIEVLPEGTAQAMEQGLFDVMP